LARSAFPLRPDAAALLFLAAYFAAWYWPSLAGGRICAGEDLFGKYFAMRAELYRMAHGGGFSWWNPLPGLGMPRLGNIEHGCFSPFSLLFYLVPTATAYRFYPLVLYLPMGALTYALFRVRGAGPLPALFGCLSYVTLVQSHLQHPPIAETLAWLPATLLCWSLFCRSGRPGWLVAGGLTVAFQCFGGFPQYLLYNFLVMAFWMGIDLARDRKVLGRRGLLALAMVALGLLWAAWQLLPALEMAGRSQRNLLGDPARFADTFRASPREVLLSLAGEVYWFIEPPPMAFAPPSLPYANEPWLSLATLAAALLTLVRGRPPWGAWLAVVFFLLGMLGSAGGVTPLLGKLIPFAGQLRAPVRMIVPAGFFLSWLAALGLQRGLQGGSAGARALALGALVWLAGAAWNLHRDRYPFVSPSEFEVPPALRQAAPRLAADLLQPPPYFDVNAGMIAGKSCLVFVETLIPGNYFEAMFASQLGSLEQKDKIEVLVGSFNIFPLVRPRLPLLASFGLRSLIRGREGQVVVDSQPALERFYVAPRVRRAPRAELWRLAGSQDWDARVEVLVEGNSSAPPEAPARPAASRVEVLTDLPDRQVLRVTSPGGVQVTSELFFPGWEVTVDGLRAQPIEVNLALRAVAVPPGTHTVEWAYRPTWLRWAVLAGVASLGVLALIFWLGRRELSP
jgi:hypothetical protein